MDNQFEKIKLPDGREFWTDRDVSKEIARRVRAENAAEIERLKALLREARVMIDKRGYSSVLLAAIDAAMEEQP